MTRKKQTPKSHSKKVTACLAAIKQAGEYLTEACYGWLDERHENFAYRTLGVKSELDDLLSDIKEELNR